MQNTNDKLHYGGETIFALATPSGRSGVAVIRLSGPEAFLIASELSRQALPSPRMVKLVKLFHPRNGDLIDHVLLIAFKAPHSFTGEDVIEIHCHGSLAVIAVFTEYLSAHPNCRLAEPGEFSRRAFYHGKMDLTEAEGLADLIDAETIAQQRQALRLMEGEVGARYESYRSQILHALALMEAYIDFPDEDIPDAVTAQVASEMTALRQELEQQLNDRGIAEKIRSGITIAIIGPPNAGKSSLINYLAQRDLAIVSPEAGTTRDAIEAHLVINGYAVTLIDTAGIRETEHQIEAEGIRRALAKAAQADFKLALFDSTAQPLYDPATLSLLNAGDIILLTKTDLLSCNPEPPPVECATLPISLINGLGLTELTLLLHERVTGQLTSHHTPLITRARHRQALQDAANYLHNFLDADGIGLECSVEDLRLAAQSIAKITGRIDVDDVLDIVFREFCIGK